MGNRFNRQEDAKIRKRIAAENIRRVFTTALICAGILPVYILINKLSGVEEASVLKGALIGFELIYLVAAGASFYAIKNDDSKISTTIVRSFWIVFEITSFVVIFSNMHEGAGLTLYAAILATLMLVPIMTMNEQMYYAIIQAVFMVFILIKFKSTAVGVCNVILLNGLMFALSRL